MAALGLQVDFNRAQTVSATETLDLAKMEREIIVVVTTDEEYQSVIDMEREAASRAATVEGIRKELKEPALEMGRRIDAFFKPIVNGYMTVKEKLGRARMKYEDDRERERRRIEAEAAAKAEAERAELGKLAGEADEIGEHALAEELREEAAAPVAVVLPEAPSAGRRENWKAECTDLGKLVAAAAAGNQVALKMLAFDDKAGSAMAKATKGVVEVPGVRFYNDPSPVTRSRQR